ncbi:MAG: hypothetical protein CO065_14065 [Comamonadaceae bacterium CG_4_9_14_0_8_um_filter_57_21]|nr:MAG: hypothetical protein CO065_14065 [Comamonadaceae bacterium CG_4_9_14_0_8_um_filter_57_21]
MHTPVITPAHRRHSLLLSLFQADNSAARTSELVRDMEYTHNLAVSSDLVRADLMWLAEVGLIRFKDDNAQLIERGRDVVMRRAPFPG